MVACGHVAGSHQTSYRGELTAMVKTVQLLKKVGRKARIWSDCQSVVRRARLILNGGRVKANSPHSDLWNLFAAAVDGLPPDHLTICKVTSHCSFTDEVSDLEQWAFWHNHQVDMLAGQCNFNRSQFFWDIWSRTVSQVCFSRNLHYEISKVFLSVGRLSHQRKLQSKLEDEPEGTPDNDQNFFEGEHDGGLIAPDQDARVRDAQEWTCSTHLRNRCLHKNVEEVLAWWTQEGLNAVTGATGPVVWISGLQIFLDFYLSSGSDGVIIHKGRWYDSIDNIPDSPHIDLSQRSRSFQYLWGKLLKENGFVVQKKLQRPRSAALAMWSQCYRIHWDEKRLAVVDQFLFELHGRQLIHAADLKVLIPKGKLATAS